ncbi:DUF302 domain-containing protein [Methylacidiphilum caldifontis]|uniref:DUF302 domain-containing protein n=1 Tax=Methylacidiphilum caldifontis TaxID=2795386 RepID=A0A4Y8PBM0_9BACT|nr:DUF302 domain-containing protein [Methylacidiphilum caldifontis]QSR89218.1 DUF302 domain-containing protein [Methylacidiphilum caldifontis]TFE68522.1 hypothetical protein A7Q10_08535 [Methylacidiphilum caldifontis]
MTETLPEGMFRYSSVCNFTDTILHLKNALLSEGFRLFATYDHSQAAKEVGLKLPPTVVLVFGNPLVGTEFMMESATLAIDLPSKLLIRENSDKTVDVFFHCLSHLCQYHKLSSLMSKASAFDERIIALIQYCIN